MTPDEASLSSAMLDKYGPLLTLVQLAGMLHRSPDGMRMALREQSEYAQSLNEAKIRIGRRIYFRTPDVARLLMGSN